MRRRHTWSIDELVRAHEQTQKALDVLPEWLVDAIDDVNIEMVAERLRWIYDNLIDTDGGEAELAIERARETAERAAAGPEEKE